VVAIGTVLVLSFSEKDKNRLKGEEVFWGAYESSRVE
jgi:hypothetical protein